MIKKIFIMIGLVFLQGRIAGANIEIAQDPYKYDMENVVFPMEETFLVEATKPIRTAVNKARKPMVNYTKVETEQVEKEVVAIAPEPAKSSEDKKMVVHFDINKSQLKKPEKEKLNSLVNSNIKGTVQVIGYTCPLGPDTFNHKLSWERAKRVKAFLAKSLKNTIVEEGKPKCCYVSESDLAQNRRVEVIFMEDPKNGNGAEKSTPLRKE